MLSAKQIASLPALGTTRTNMSDLRSMRYLNEIAPKGLSTAGRSAWVAQERISDHVCRNLRRGNVATAARNAALYFIAGEQDLAAAEYARLLAMVKRETIALGCVRGYYAINYNARSEAYRSLEASDFTPAASLAA